MKKDRLTYDEMIKSRMECGNTKTIWKTIWRTKTTKKEKKHLKKNLD